MTHVCSWTEPTVLAGDSTKVCRGRVGDERREGMGGVDKGSERGAMKKRRRRFVGGGYERVGGGRIRLGRDGRRTH